MAKLHERRQHFPRLSSRVYYPRLYRDGWRLKAEHGTSNCDRLDIFEKALDQGWILQKLAHSGIHSLPGKGCYWDEHQLRHPASNQQVDDTNWEWADWDGDRLLWATAGKIFAGNIGAQGLRDVKELYDFNAIIFEAIAAP